MAPQQYQLNQIFPLQKPRQIRHSTVPVIRPEPQNPRYVARLEAAVDAPPPVMQPPVSRLIYSGYTG